MAPRRSRQRRAVARSEAWMETAYREFPPTSQPDFLGSPPPPEPLAAVEAGEGRAVLVLEPRQPLTFIGKCRLRCLFGAVRVLGFTVASHHPGLPLFSPSTHCALTLQAWPDDRPLSAVRQLRDAARTALREHRVHRRVRAEVMERFASDGALVLLEHLDTPVTRFLLSHQPLSRIFEPQKKESSFVPQNAALAALGVVRCSRDRGLQMSESMSLTLENLYLDCCAEDEGIPVVLVCGPKNIGKSTFNRCLINLILNRLPAVEYMECDIGQPEFTPPGCVSLSSVTEPLLGPPFTHQQMPHKMVYFGQTSCEQDTERYLDVVKSVFSCYNKEVPLIINTMGWVKGDGMLLLIDMIRLLSPSHVVQMDVRSWKEVELLTPEHVHLHAGLHTKGKQQPKCKQLSTEEDWEWPEGEDASVPQYQLQCVHPEFPRAGMAGEARVHSGILRDMSVLGYLGQLQYPDIGAVVPLHSLVPYQVPFSAVALRVVHTDVAPTNIMYAVNASWVGLCCIPDEIRGQTDGPVLLTQTPLCDCLGFGIVRGVDMEKKLYYILTPVPPEKLRLVNCLLLGNITIPSCMLVCQQGVKGEIPYVTSDYNYNILGAGKLRKKKYFVRKGFSFTCD